MHRTTWALVAGLGAASLCALTGGCTDRKGALGAQCAHNSDCEALLICVVGTCREECREDRDCPLDQSCEPSGLLDRRACLSPGSRLPCAVPSDCPSDATCEARLCFRLCADDSGCAGSGVCTDGHCSDPILTLGRVVDGGVDSGPPPVCSDDELGMGMIVCGDTCVQPGSNPLSCGGCGIVCPSGACASGACVPENDRCEDASPVALGPGPATLSGVRAGASDRVDSCSGGPDVYFSFELTRREIVYLRTTSGEARVGYVDTCGTSATGCGMATSVRILDPGTHRVVVDPNTDAFEVILEHIPVTGTEGARFVPGMAATAFVGSTAGGVDTPGTCGAGPDRFYWWLTDRDFAGGTFEAGICVGVTYPATLELANGDGTRLCAAAGTCGAGTRLSTDVPAGGGLHVLFVDGDMAMDEGGYSLTVTVP